MDIWSFLGNIGNAIVNELVNLMQTIMKSVMDSINNMVQGILQAVGIPFTTWSNVLAGGNGSNYGYSIPIIFVAVLGFAFLVFIVFIDIYGIEETAGDTIGIALKDAGL